MGIALAIMGGIILLTGVAGYFDYLGKKTKSGGTEVQAQLERLEAKVQLLETALAEKTERLDSLEREVSFVNKLLEDKSGR